MLTPNQIPDIKEIIPPPDLNDPNISLLIVVGIIIGSIIILSHLIINWLKLRVPNKTIKNNDYRKRAIKELHDLKLNFSKISSKDLASEIIRCIQPFIQSKFGIISSSLTTEEFITYYKEYSTQVIGFKFPNEFIELLNSCDQLRFSPNNGNNSERENLIINSIKLVRSFPEINENSPTTLFSICRAFISLVHRYSSYIYVIERP